MKLRMSLWLCLCLAMSLFTPQGVANQTTVSYASEAAYVKTGGADLNMRSEPKKACHQRNGSDGSTDHSADDDTCGRADDSTDGSSTTDDGYRVSYAGQL